MLTDDTSGVSQDQDGWTIDSKMINRRIKTHLFNNTFVENLHDYTSIHVAVLFFSSLYTSVVLLWDIHRQFQTFTTCLRFLCCSSTNGYSTYGTYLRVRACRRHKFICIIGFSSRNSRDVTGDIGGWYEWNNEADITLPSSLIINSISMEQR